MSHELLGERSTFGSHRHCGKGDISLLVFEEHGFVLI